MAAYEQKKETILGVEYTFQRVPPYQWTVAKYDATDKNGQMMPHKLYNYICENIIVAPKVEMNDFEYAEDLEEVMQAAVTFQHFRPKDNGKK